MDILFSSTPLGWASFLFITVIIGGAMAYATGKAISQTWRPYWNVPVYMLILSAAERFLHYALAGENLKSIQFFLVSFVFSTLIATIGYRKARVAQMTTQYSWLFNAAGPFGWKAK